MKALMAAVLVLLGVVAGVAWGKSWTETTMSGLRATIQREATGDPHVEVSFVTSDGTESVPIHVANAYPGMSANVRAQARNFLRSVEEYAYGQRTMPTPTPTPG